jgi:hypothetical protein
MDYGSTQLPQVPLVRRSSWKESCRESDRGDNQLSPLLTVVNTLGEATIAEYTEWIATSLVVIIDEALNHSSASLTAPETMHHT